MKSSEPVRVTRTTQETTVNASLLLVPGAIQIETGIGFLDHLLTLFTFHAGLSLSMQCDGDTEVDDHHSAEDCAIVLGQVIDQALGTRHGIARFGHAYAPMDEALARAVIDLSGRPHASVSLCLRRDAIGSLACENIEHVITSIAMASRSSIHVDVLRGENDHHKAEAAFKAIALAMSQALSVTSERVPSSKGVI